MIVRQIVWFFCSSWGQIPYKVGSFFFNDAWEIPIYMTFRKRLLQALEKVPIYEKRINDLEKEIDSMKVEHQREIDNLLPHRPVTQPDNFKEELAEAIQQIRSEFHRIAAEHRVETEHLNQIQLDQMQQQREREALAMGEKVRSLQTELDRLRHSIDEAQNEVSKTYFLYLFQVTVPFLKWRENKRRHFSKNFS